MSARIREAYASLLEADAAADTILFAAREQMDRAWGMRVLALERFRETVIEDEGNDGWRNRWAKVVLYDQPVPIEPKRPTGKESK